MKASVPNAPEGPYLDNLLVRSPLAYSPVEARLFARALGGLLPESPQLSFQLAFDDIVPGGNAGGQQYAQLRVAIKRLMQAVKDKSLREEQGCSLYIQLFSVLSLDVDTEQIRGKFNPDLREHLLHLGGKFTTAELEALLMRSQTH
ncbi:replication initiation protein [Hymenobacter arizonensis]|uniref:Initiator Replication protein n=1 Tax=Hymenobacter arizonensis TaxID=1227077 RepID=A0A1I6BMG2_HYMAR|nr:replication initiation protein [Hymenobacter arizonensis]SFQ82128.1 Initiator Replication protein [Hymenobacter arizonensis]